MKNLILCNCCQSELTMPQYHNGLPYGWTCITKVCPSAKRVKAIWLPCELESVHIADGTTQFTAVIALLGCRIKVTGYAEMLTDESGVNYANKNNLRIRGGSAVVTDADGGSVVQVTRDDKSQIFKGILDLSGIIRKRK